MRTIHCGKMVCRACITSYIKCILYCIEKQWAGLLVLMSVERIAKKKKFSTEPGKGWWFCGRPRIHWLWAVEEILRTPNFRSKWRRRVQDWWRWRLENFRIWQIYPIRLHWKVNTHSYTLRWSFLSFIMWLRIIHASWSQNLTIYATTVKSDDIYRWKAKNACRYCERKLDSAQTVCSLTQMSLRFRFFGTLVWAL